MAAEKQNEAGAYERMAAASGWDPEFQRKRMVQMAYNGLFRHAANATCSKQPMT